MENPEEYKGENFNTIEGAWDWHSRGIPETVYSPEELEYLMGEQIMFKKDFEEATAKLLSQLQPANNDYSVKESQLVSDIKERIYDLQMMQIQAGDDYEFCLQMEYAIKELNRLLTPNN